MTATVIDSGVAQLNAEFTGRIHPASTDLAGSRGIQDEGGHGTAVSDVLLGAKNDVGIQGIAFEATLLVARTDTPGSCANTDPQKGCTHADNAIARGVDLAVVNNARVINISLGGSPANATLRAAIARATTAGVIIVFSAGNEGVDNPGAAVNPDPLAQIANDALARNLVIIAGALDASNGALADFSNKAGNSSPHYLGALGVRVRAIDEAGTSFLWSGTSFAAPIVSGAVALLAQAFPNLTSAQIVDLLFRSAIDIGDPGIDPIFGNGAIDLSRAFAPQGSLTLAGSAIPVSVLTSGTTSTPMGDAGQRGQGLPAVILDGYGRAYESDFGRTIARAPLSPKLAPALGIGTRSLSMAGGGTSIAVSIAPGREGVSVDRLLLSAHDEAHAQALAGSVVTRLGPNTSIALGISRSGLALANQLNGRGGDPFLVGASAVDSVGFDTRARSGLAIQQQLGGIALTASAENGAARLWDGGSSATFRRGYRDHDYDSLSLGAQTRLGTLTLSARATNLIERETVLGGRFDALIGAKGARSWFADLEARWVPLRNWSLASAWRQGWTRLSAGGARQSTDHLHTTAWSFDLSRHAILGRDDRFSLRVAQPLRVGSGGFDLTLPTSYDYFSRQAGFAVTRLNLSPTGRERDIEAVYTRPLWRGQVSANAFWRHEPGNQVNAPEDLGAAIRFTLGL